LKLFLIFLSITQAFSLTFLPRVKQTKKISGATHKAHKRSFNPNLKRLKAENVALKSLAHIRVNTPYVWNKGALYKPGDMLPGTLSLSLLSTNLDAPIVISLDGPENRKVLCTGGTKHKRVIARCDRLLTLSGTTEINASLLETDGSLGLRGDVYTGKEEFIAGIIVSEMAKGALTVSQSRLNTSLGSTVAPTSKNMILEGLINTSNEVTDLMKEEMKTREPKIFVRAPKRVIVFFNAGVGTL
jgi:hypothetical protein